MALIPDITDFVQEVQGGRADVTAGRVSILDLGAEALKIVGRPDRGNVSVNPDGTVALVLTDPSFRGNLSFEVEVAGRNGPEIRTVELRAIAGSQDDGWGAGDHYTLAVDDGGDSVVEVGRNHRKVYVSGSDGALSVADIAAREEVPVGTINRQWLKDHPEYGGSPEMALDLDAGMALWSKITGRSEAPSSHALLFERGYSYDLKGLVQRGSEGESPLHPLSIGAWGSGDRPVIESMVFIIQEPTKNLVIRDIEFAGGISAQEAENLLIEDSVFTKEQAAVIGGERFTLRDSQVIDVIREESRTPDVWATGDNRISGLYLGKTDGVLIEEVLFDHSGWAEDYSYDRGLSGGQPPSKFSHNLYVQNTVSDFTLRDSVSLRGASFGAQVRPGGVVEGNVFADNNAGLLVANGMYSLVLDNVITSGAHKTVDQAEGALTMGAESAAEDASLVRNIIAHLADFTDPEELARKIKNHPDLLLSGDPLVDDTIIYNWLTENRRERFGTELDQNAPDIPGELLDKVTSRYFVEDVLGVNDPDDVFEVLSDWLRENWDDGDTAAILRGFFQDGFGIGLDERGAATSVRFVPDPHGNGQHWSSWLNWSTNDVPIDGDSVDLGGNWVTYSGTTTLQALDLGEAGVLTVRQGLLETGRLAVGEEGGRLQIDLAGQVWTDGYDDEDLLTVDADGGRFANTGAFSGPVDLQVAGRAEAILATGGATFSLDGSLTIDGSQAHLGFDGRGGGRAAFELTDASALAYVSDGKGISAISEFRSGHWGLAAPDIRSEIALDGALSLDLGRLSLGTGVKTSLMAAADEITGGFDTITLSGVAPGRVSVRLDYGADTLELVTDSRGAARSSPELRMTGSDAADVFVAAAGARTVVEKYAAGDILDLSAVVGAGDLQLVREGNGAALLDGGARVATFSGGDIDAVRVRIDGSQSTIKAIGEGVPPPANVAPIADDGEFGGAADAVVSGRVTASDADGDALVYALRSGPAAGKVTLEADGRFVYDPQGAYDDLLKGETRSVTFGYSVSDGRGGSDAGSVKLVLSGQAAPPPETVPPPANVAPIADDGEFGGAADAVVSGRVTASDADGDALVYALRSGPAAGKVTLEADGRFVYDPQGAYDDLLKGETRSVTFGYSVSDGRGGSDAGSVKLVLSGQAVPPPELNPINGSDAWDALQGTEAADVIRSGGGVLDRIWGKGGDDYLVFGAEAADGQRNKDVVLDFDSNEDVLVLEAGAEIESSQQRDGSVVLTLAGDGDTVVLAGLDITVEDIKIVESDGVWMA